MEANVTIWITIQMQEEVQNMNISFTFNGQKSLDFNDYIDACKRAALAFGYSENTVNNFFEK